MGHQLLDMIKKSINYTPHAEKRRKEEAASKEPAPQQYKNLDENAQTIVTFFPFLDLAGAKACLVSLDNDMGRVQNWLASFSNEKEIDDAVQNRKKLFGFDEAENAPGPASGLDLPAFERTTTSA